jgi:triosephosphate isomerase
MPAESTHRDIHTGDVSGAFVVGDNNRVTNTTRHSERRQQPHQQNSAEDQAAVFAVEHGTMHVTYNAETEHEAEG